MLIVSLAVSMLSVSLTLLAVAVFWVCRDVG